MAESQHDAETAGVSTALDRTCALEARLRSAIQATHPLADSLDRNPAAAEREREALLDITCAPVPTPAAALKHRIVSSQLEIWSLSAVKCLWCYDPACRQQLELLEDKLREFRTLGPMQHDDKVHATHTAVQLMSCVGWTVARDHANFLSMPAC